MNANTMPADYALESNETQAIDDAIAQSRETNTVVRMEWDNQAAEQAEDYLATCEGYMDSARLDGEIDAWGDDWRISLVLGDIAAW